MAACDFGVFRGDCAPTRRRNVVKLYIRLAAALLISGTCVLTASADPPANSLWWDIDTIDQAGPGGTAPAGAWDDISATWNANSNGSGVPGVWSNDPLTNAVFAAGNTATGTYIVTMGATEHVDGIYFEEGNVTIAPGTGGLALEGTGIIDVASGASGTISSTITGTTNIAKNGVGTLTLSADNTAAGYAAGLDVNNGTLSVTNGGAIGTGGDFTPATVHSGGTLQVSGAISIPTVLNINGDGFNSTGAIRKTANNTTTMTGGLTLGSASRIRSENGTLTISGSPIVMGGNDLTFAGTASGTTGNITVSANINSNDGTTITKEGQGILTLSGTNIGSLRSKFKVLGGTLSWSSDNGFTNDLGAGPASPVADYVIVDGGTLRMTTNDTTGTSFMRANRGIQLGPNGGTINMSSTTVAAKALYGTSATAGTGTIGLTTGTTAATLTKTGAAEFRWSGAGTQTAGFTKLVIKQGLYRAGSVTGANYETVLGAVPSVSTPDAVEFTGTAANPAYFASSFNMTSTLAWNVNRGVKFTGEGTFLGTSGVEVNVLGPISGSGKLIAGSATSPYNTGGTFNSGTVRLSNANNASTFTGSVAANNGTLILNTSLNATNFSGTDTVGNGTGTSAADVNLNGSSVVFTAGSDNTSTSFAGRMIGTGTFTKVGTGTFTLSTAGTNAWTNTGGVKINAGSIKYGNAASALADTVPVTIDGTSAVAGQSGTLDLTDPTVTGDTIGSLISTSGNTFGQILQGNANLTLGATATTARTYRGSITSTGGSFTKGGGTFTQNLEQGAVNNTLGAVNVNLGRLNFNGINTTGAVTVASTATLGGKGSVTGAVSVQSGGILAPGTSIGTFGEGALTMVSGSTFQYELNTSGTPAADLLNVGGALSLGGATLFTDDLATTPIALTAGSKFTLMSYQGAWDTTTFAGINNGDTVTVDGIGYKIKYDDTSAGSLNAGSLYSSAVTLSIPSAGCAPGDLNCDTHVDAGDYVFWRKNGGTPNDANYTAWRTNFGTPPGAGSGGGLNSAAVPEPSGIALLMVALAAFATGRRGR